jgi:hypothetical protein
VTELLVGAAALAFLTWIFFFATRRARAAKSKAVRPVDPADRRPLASFGLDPPSKIEPGVGGADMASGRPNSRRPMLVPWTRAGICSRQCVVSEEMIRFGLSRWVHYNIFNP